MIAGIILLRRHRTDPEACLVTPDASVLQWQRLLQAEARLSQRSCLSW